MSNKVTRHISARALRCIGLLTLSLAAPAAIALGQDAASAAPVSVVPHVIKFSGALSGASNKAETVDVKFALYAAQTGGEALWSETQQVSLDASGKYSVLLGSSSALPDSAFAQGQARWIGVTLGSEQESARTVLVATPYSLKASDAETLGGHPVSDFTLKNALPAGGTNITQINVGNGVTGGGTGPTVTLGLSSSYLETLGNGIYPQLNGTNKFGGKNTFTAGDLLLGTSPVLSAANVTGTSPVTATVSGNSVKIGLSDSALLTLGNGVYAQSKGNNTFSGTNTFNGAVTLNSTLAQTGTTPVNGFMSSVQNNSTASTGAIAGLAATVGVAGEATLSTLGATDFQAGVEGVTNAPGLGSYGVYGSARQGSFSTGVYGVAGQVSTTGQSWQQSFGGAGVWGDTDQGQGYLGEALLGTADDQSSAILIDNSTDFYTLFVYNIAPNGSLFRTENGATGAGCIIDGSGDLDCDGNLSGSNLTADQHRIETYAVQSSEAWVEDFGTAQLSSGSGHVTIDPAFAATVNTGVEYHVFLTPRGNSEGLYIANQSGDSFDVRESRGGRSTLVFDYRIVAKRRGHESVRLADITGRDAYPGSPSRKKPMVKPEPRQPRAMPSAANNFGLASAVAPSSTK